MAAHVSRVVLFILLDYSEPKFVGLAWEPQFNQTIQEHRRTKPPFMVQVVGVYNSLYAAQAAARPLIKRFHTQMFGWNKTDYGDLDAKPLVNPGGYKWNDGVDCRRLPKYDSWRKVKSEGMRACAIANNFGARLPINRGDEHPMKREETREKLKATSTGRRRFYFEDGTWTWCYSKDHLYAFRNRENGIPALEDLTPEQVEALEQRKWHKPKKKAA